MEAELLLAIPEAISGTAKLWFNAMGENWANWLEFSLAARKHFGKVRISKLIWKFKSKNAPKDLKNP